MVAVVGIEGSDRPGLRRPAAAAPRAGHAGRPGRPLDLPRARPRAGRDDRALSSRRSTRARRPPGACCSTGRAGWCRSRSASTTSTSRGPGWVEHDAAEIWSIVRRIVPQAIADAGDRAAADRGAGRDQPARDDGGLGPAHRASRSSRAIVWQDTRTAAACWPACSARTPPPMITARTGLPMATYFSAPEAALAAGPRPGAAAGAPSAGDLLFGTMDSWISWNLTGGPGGEGRAPGLHVTDVTNASRTMLMNLETLDWDDGSARRVRRAAGDDARDPARRSARSASPSTRCRASRSAR